MDLDAVLTQVTTSLDPLLTHLTAFLDTWVPWVRSVVPWFGATCGLGVLFVIAAALGRRIVAFVVAGWIIALVTLALWLAPPITGEWAIAGLVAFITALAFTVTPKKK